LDDAMGTAAETGAGRGRELLGWFILFLGAGALQLPALGRMANHDVDILEFELMWTSAEAARLLAVLGPDGVSAVRQQLFIDFGYLVIYGVMLWKACRLLGARAGRRQVDWVAKAAPGFAWAAVVAAACDAVENISLLLVTYGYSDQPWPALASGYATAKFVLLGAVVLFLLVGLLPTLKGASTGPADRAPSEAG